MMVRISPVRVLRYVGVLSTFMVLVWISQRTNTDLLDQPSQSRLTTVVTAQEGFSETDENNISESLTKGNKPTLVFLLSYQRSGSTYVCHLFKDTSLLHREGYIPQLFDSQNNHQVETGAKTADDIYDHVINQTDHVFFLYEPLDALYTGMFGTEQAWNIGGDIFNDVNGSQRILPDYEQKAVTWYLGKIFECEMADLPPGILLHKFWNGFRGSMPLTHQYSSCIINQTGLNDSSWHLQNEVCRKHIKKICGGRFGDKPWEQENVCRNNLWGSDLDPSNYIPNAVRFADGMNPDLNTSKIEPEFRDYFQCMAKFTKITRQCAYEYFDKPCRRASVRAIKTVRSQMDTVLELYNRFSNLKVIHSFRHPQAIVNSRMHTSWAVNFHARKNITEIARNYCNNVYRNNKILESMNTNRTRVILYDDFVRHPTSQMKEIYKFLSRKIPGSVLSEFKHNEEEKTKYIKRGDKWHKSLSKSHQAIVSNECSKLMTDMKTQFRSYF